MPYIKITNTKVLVTGGVGFLPSWQAGIGSNLCVDLLRINNEVIPLFKRDQEECICFQILNHIDT